MKAKTVGKIALLDLILTTTWIILTIVGMLKSGSMDTFDQILEYVSNQDPLFYTLNYLNAALLTVVTAILFVSIYLFLKDDDQTLATIGVIFIPIYGAFNLVVYLSQVTVIPVLLELRDSPQYESSVDVFLRLTIQLWPDSGIAFINVLGYAILAIPSILFGLVFIKQYQSLKFAGYLLIVSGILSLIGIFGSIFQISVLNLAVMLSGVFFLLFFIPFTLVMFSMD